MYVPSRIGAFYPFHSLFLQLYLNVIIAKQKNRSLFWFYLKTCWGTNGYLITKVILYYIYLHCWQIGKVNVNVAPLASELFFAHILPPWASIILFEINIPNPVPVCDFVANFVNSLGNICRSIPMPLSFMLTIDRFFVQ